MRIRSQQDILVSYKEEPLPVHGIRQPGVPELPVLD